MNSDTVADFRQGLDALLGRAQTLLSPHLGRPFAWPMRTADILALAKALGYTVDLRAIDRHIMSGSVKRPKKVGRELIWTKHKALDLLMRLEQLRAWTPLAPLHTHKMTCYERAKGAKAIAKQTAHFADGMRARPDYAALSPKQLITEAVDAPTAPLRRWAIYCLRSRLSLVDAPSDVLVAEAMRTIADGPDADQRGELGAVLMRWLNGIKDDSIIVRAVVLGDLIAQLRSCDLAERFMAGMELARSLGAGMKEQGLDETEVELMAGKDASDLIARAIGGDGAAVDQLADAMTPDRAKASQSPAEPSNEAIQLADTGAMELLDQLEHKDLTADRRRTLVEALAIATGQRSDDGAGRSELCSVLDGVLDGDGDAIASARSWIVEHLIARSEGA